MADSSAEKNLHPPAPLLLPAGGGGESSRLECEVLVVGAGPAGLAAAVAASSKQFKVIMIDENPSLGGQIWRSMGQETTKIPIKLLTPLVSANLEILSPASVFDIPNSDTALAHGTSGIYEIHFQKLILATGARELFLPFPGWTLPGVFGVGGLQALVKQGLSIRGKRIVIAGSGPLLLAVAKHLGDHGAKVVGLYEQAPPRSFREFAFSLRKHPSKLKQVFSFFWTTMKLKPGWWVVSAVGAGKLSSVEVTNGQVTRAIECDYLACAYGLVPNTELADIAGCRIEKGFVWVDEYQRTSEERIFCAGEPVEIGGVDAAIVQGSIAGLAAVGSDKVARRYFRDREHSHSFAQSLASAFKLRPELARLSTDDTLICRCEDVRYGEIKDKASFREAKIHTRIGMGPCQGRVCGAACQAMLGWEAPTVRPPVVPVEIREMAQRE